MSSPTLFPNQVDGNKTLSNETLKNLRIPGFRDAYSAAPNLHFFQKTLNLKPAQAYRLFSEILALYKKQNKTLSNKFKTCDDYIFCVLSWMCRGLNFHNASRRAFIEAKGRSSWKKKQNKYWRKK